MRRLDIRNRGEETDEVRLGVICLPSVLLLKIYVDVSYDTCNIHTHISTYKERVYVGTPLLSIEVEKVYS